MFIEHVTVLSFVVPSDQIFPSFSLAVKVYVPAFVCLLDPPTQSYNVLSGIKVCSDLLYVTFKQSASVGIVVFLSTSNVYTPIDPLDDVVIISI